jgi:hypothetical protein
LNIVAAKAGAIELETREAQPPSALLAWMLIYLNAAIESWQTVNGRFPDAGSLTPNNDPVNG